MSVIHPSIVILQVSGLSNCQDMNRQQSTESTCPIRRDCQDTLPWMTYV
jgi:hypothetical protein